MANDGIALEISADTKSLEESVREIGRSTPSLVRKMGTGIGLLDTRSGLLRQDISKLLQGAEKTGNAFSSFVRVVGTLTEIDAIKEIGKQLAELTDESAQVERNIEKFAKMEPRALSKGFADLVSQAEALRRTGGPGAGHPAIPDA